MIDNCKLILDKDVFYYLRISLLRCITRVKLYKKSDLAYTLFKSTDDFIIVILLMCNYTIMHRLVYLNSIILSINEMARKGDYDYLVNVYVNP
jgi:5'-3' exonuclease